MRLKKMTNPDSNRQDYPDSNRQDYPDIENERTLTFRIKLQLLHFQSSARSAKKSNDFFGIIEI